MIDRMFWIYIDCEYCVMVGLLWGGYQIFIIILFYLDKFLYIGVFSGVIFGLDVKICFDGVFVDVGKFNKQVYYLFLGCGMEEWFGI